MSIIHNKAIFMVNENCKVPRNVKENNCIDNLINKIEYKNMNTKQKRMKKIITIIKK